jgi:outer membrane cobalamin receptor
MFARRRPVAVFTITVWILLWGASPQRAEIFGVVRGIVHDPQHHPVKGVRVALRAQESDWEQETQSDEAGRFSFTAVPAGGYVLRMEREGFQFAEASITVASGSAPIRHFALEVGAVTQRMEVSAAVGPVDTESAATQSAVSRSEIERAPGADRTNSLQLITDFVPGAYLVHDQLHVRGGHQVSWLVDGVPVPNTNIAGNVGPQFDPKDVETFEVQRGGYSAEYGDRTYGVFNVVTRSGFERNREGELVASFGSYKETNDQLSFGDHTNRFAYYASVDANRTDLGLETPSPQVIHDMGRGVGGFVSLIFNATPADQLLLVTAVRGDHFQIPNLSAQQAAGIRDVQEEHDAFANFSWVRTFGSGMLLTVSPFYHFNAANFDGGQNDTPLVTTDHRRSQYAGGQVTFAVVRARHNAHAGVYGFAQRDDDFFRLEDNVGGTSLSQRFKPAGNLEALFVEDEFKLTQWFSLSGGVRLTHFSGGLDENAASPRAGAAIRVPLLNWVVRGSYSRYYQAPPLATISGPLLRLALQQGFGFLPLRGERDEQYEFGAAIPFHGWVIDTDYFRARARNFFDHDVIGNSNIFLPLTIATARIRGWETTVRSPRAYRHTQFHLAYSHQFAEGRGGVNGGLTSFQPPSTDFFFLDHDQRNTLVIGGELPLPRASWISASAGYGSGFLDGNGPGHKPGHTIFNIAVGKSFGETWSLAFTALNAGDAHFLLDISNTFGGTKFNSPRQWSGEVRYRFHF